MNAVGLCRLAEAYQRGMDHGEHRIDQRMRERAWLWWSQAQALGMILG
jgi:hypothetical protein